MEMIQKLLLPVLGIGLLASQGLADDPILFEEAIVTRGQAHEQGRGGEERAAHRFGE